MELDFSTISIYELLALILSAVAIFVPLIKWAWNKWITKPILNFLPTGKAQIFTNRSGSYMELDGVFEAQKKPVTIKQMSLKVKRKKDDKILNLNWSTFVSPVNQKTCWELCFYH